MCSQICENKKGGYKCGCRHGYEWDDADHQCRASGNFVTFPRKYSSIIRSTVCMRFTTKTFLVWCICTVCMSVLRPTQHWLHGAMIRKWMAWRHSAEVSAWEFPKQVDPKHTQLSHGLLRSSKRHTYVLYMQAFWFFYLSSWTSLRLQAKWYSNSWNCIMLVETTHLAQVE